MRYFYRSPPPELHGLVGSFYLMDTPHSASDLVRVEIPHIRFLFRGHSVLSIAENSDRFEAGTALVCGPSFKTGSVRVSEHTLIIGASLTPQGWHRLLNISAAELADRKVDIGQMRPDFDTDALQTEMAAARDDDDMFRVVERSLIGLIRDDVVIREDFLAPTIDWATDLRSPGIDELVESTGISSRQVDRLCRFYFGGSPKRVHRVFRALKTAYRLATEDVTDWREVVDPFYDQSHLIREFQDRIGCTPRAFMTERRMMMRMDVELRRQVTGISDYCLIG